MEMLMRTLKFSVDTKDSGILINKDSQESIKIIGYADSSFATDKDTRLSVTGYVIYSNNSIIAWKPKNQSSITLSSTESEHVALSKCLMEMIFIKQVCESVNKPIQTPMILHTDNTGSIGIFRNATTSGRTRHVDIRWNFIREWITKGWVIIKHISTKFNISDACAKNLNTEQHNNHSTHLVTDSDFKKFTSLNKNVAPLCTCAELD